MWNRLDHPNIVPFKGVTLTPLQLVSEWMSGGELRDYLKKHPDANPISLVSPIPIHLSKTPYPRLSCLVSPTVLLIFTPLTLFTEISKGWVLSLILEHPL